MLLRLPSLQVYYALTHSTLFHFSKREKELTSGLLRRKSYFQSLKNKNIHLLKDKKG